ncbi:MAG: AAA family ATPase, partial [Planctomycetota bacterium]
KWCGVLGPFRDNQVLRGRIAELETLVSRLGNLVARCDGDLDDRERQALKAIEQEFTVVLQPLTLDEAAGDGGPDRRRAKASPATTGDSATAIDEALTAASDIFGPRESRPNGPAAAIGGRSNQKGTPSPQPDKPTRLSVEDALAELDRLIGLSGIKHEVRSLANFLRLQQRREATGLPATDISLHMVFTGNPGTGKTTVARIVAKVFGALGVLEKGHLIETDRSGLVAEYAGQTGPKTNKKVDEALGGLLFIDEAYSLVARESDDPYGREAAQALLKRAEDDRDRLVVTLAGYPDEMDTLLRSNPGLSSRFNRRLAFEDYKPEELCRIFGLMCNKNHYRLASAARLKVIVGMQALFERRDRHFGNGRAARNLFEHAVRRMANRLA